MDLLVARQQSACVCIKLNFDSGGAWVTLLLSYPLHYSVVSSHELLFSAPFISSFLDFLPLLIRSGSDRLESEASCPEAAAGSRCVPKTLKCKKKKNFATDAVLGVILSRVRNLQFVPAAFDFSVIAALYSNS